MGDGADMLKRKNTNDGFDLQEAEVAKEMDAEKGGKYVCKSSGTFA